MRSATCKLANQAILDATDGHEAIHWCASSQSVWGVRLAGVTGGNYRRGGGINADPVVEDEREVEDI